MAEWNEKAGSRGIKWYLLAPIAMHPCVVRSMVLSVWKAPRNNPMLMNAVFATALGGGELISLLSASLCLLLWCVAKQSPVLLFFLLSRHFLLVDVSDAH